MTPAAEVGDILLAAAQAGVTYLDTAPAYGKSEQVLGRFAPRLKPFRVTTKTARVPEAGSADQAAAVVAEGFRQSLERLQLDCCYGLIVHNADELLSPLGGRIFAELRRLKDGGQAAKIGVSVYTAAQIDAILGQFDVDLVQLPVSVFDQRLIRSGHLKMLRANGVEVHARSVFLQGALLMEPAALPPAFGAVRDRIDTYRQCIAREGLRPLQAALGFAMGLQHVDCVVCGVNTRQQLEEIVASATPLPATFFDDFALDQASVLNPGNWTSS
jgi:aryl-alcohol dehydrogenase-like predicted oxidoreductase